MFGGKIIKFQREFFEEEKIINFDGEIINLFFEEEIINQCLKEKFHQIVMENF